MPNNRQNVFRAKTILSCSRVDTTLQRCYFRCENELAAAIKAHQKKLKSLKPTIPKRILSRLQNLRQGKWSSFDDTSDSGAARLGTTNPKIVDTPVSREQISLALRQLSDAFGQKISEHDIEFIRRVSALNLPPARLDALAQLAEKTGSFGWHTFFESLDRYGGDIILAKQSFSQEGEDLILKKMLGGKNDGFFVDVGAYHPAMYSNTLFFYGAGWRGINIEPNADNFTLFESQRPRDINVNCAVGAIGDTYYVFEEQAYNTFSAERVKELSDTLGKEPVERLTGIASRSLSEILAEHETREIDFLNIDVEGSELAVLESNDWQRFSPRAIVIEQTEREISKILQSPVYQFLERQEYRLVVMTYSTCIYQRIQSDE